MGRKIFCILITYLVSLTLYHWWFCPEPLTMTDRVLSYVLYLSDLFGLYCLTKCDEEFRYIKYLLIANIMQSVLFLYLVNIPKWFNVKDGDWLIVFIALMHFSVFVYLFDWYRNPDEWQQIKDENEETIREVRESIKGTRNPYAKK